MSWNYCTSVLYSEFAGFTCGALLTANLGSSLLQVSWWASGVRNGDNSTALMPGTRVSELDQSMQRPERYRRRHRTNMVLVGTVALKSFAKARP